MAVLEVISSVADKSVAAVVEGAKKGAEVIKNLSDEEMKEIAKQKIEDIKTSGDAVMSKLDDIKNLTPEQLQEKFNEVIDEKKAEKTSDISETEEKSEGLTDEEKAKIKEKTGWSDEIINAIGTMEEYEIYKKAGLVEVDINGKKCLIRTDIDWNQKDAMGRTNRERAEQGLSPINKDGKVIELHHIGQHSDSPLAELTTEEHRGKGNDTILHNKAKESEIDRQAFTKERNDHWGARANEGGSQ
ncbi:MAG: HNH/ENDO VII family nuclease [Butyrivibrio sp.]|uniref:HNH/ENDO VII family nuclease n=1 Tax=Butyrivibrio sp. TaxID=28121 RepID=UPI0025EBC9D1|nr:HNH/ENDO VII family nuclease [Butyrivibrio sp.]MCR5769706.1 HNH/ENDO VII family nuclease [Butyrivibrio sp.]